MEQFESNSILEDPLKRKRISAVHDEKYGAVSKTTWLLWNTFRAIYNPSLKEILKSTNLTEAHNLEREFPILSICNGVFTD